MLKIADLSHYQTVSDWKKVAKAVDYVICKATQGTSYVDPTFADKMKHARENKIPFGSYHFANGTDAVKEAKFYLKTVGELQENDLLCLDYEIHLSDPVHWCKTFLSYCYQTTGVRPLLYLNNSTVKGFDWSSIADKYPLWVASYPNQ
jgi:lysozyme